MDKKKMTEENKDCIFCKIVKGEIPAVKVYEDEKVIAIPDINPYAKGHIMVIPKEHSRWVWNMKKEEYIYLMEKVKYLAEVLRKAFNVEWIEEVIAGIGVPHTHIHLLPRKENDGLGEVPTKPLDPKPTEQEQKKIIEKIKENL